MINRASRLKFAVFSFVYYLAVLPLFGKDERKDLLFDWAKRREEYAPFVNNEKLSKDEYVNTVTRMSIIGACGLIMAIKIAISLILILGALIFVSNRYYEMDNHFIATVFLCLNTIFVFPLSAIGAWWNSKFSRLSQITNKDNEKNKIYEGKFYLRDIYLPLIVAILFSLFMFWVMSINR